MSVLSPAHGDGTKQSTLALHHCEHIMKYSCRCTPPPLRTHAYTILKCFRKSIKLSPNNPRRDKSPKRGGAPCNCTRTRKHGAICLPPHHKEKQAHGLSLDFFHTPREIPLRLMDNRPRSIMDKDKVNNNNMGVKVF